MVVLPTFFPVTTPFLETTAMAFFLLVHLQDFTFTVLFFLTFKVTFLPFLTDTLVLFRRTGVFFAAFAGTLTPLSPETIIAADIRTAISFLLFRII